MQNMPAVDARLRRCLATAALIGAVAVTAGASAQSAATPGGLPAHEMLEDPFNRSLVFDELELRGGDDLSWDADAWLGYAFNRFTIRTEGERADGETERAELELLWTRAVARWWDVVAGARADFEPGPSQKWAAVGIQGLAPYGFGLQATAFIGESRATAVRLEGEYELKITSRWVLQPQLELNWYGQSDPARRLGSGLSSVEAALRLRYEFRREVAPYLGLVRERLFGTTADFARAAGADADDSSLVAGIRLRF
jgi:copper resistance protein B